MDHSQQQTDELARSTPQPPRQRRLLRWVLFVAGFGLIVGLAATWHVGGMLVAPANCSVGPPPDDLPVESLMLQSETGSAIAAWYVPAEDAHATVILLHGIRSTRRSMLGRARLFHRAGFACVLIDLQAHGESPGKHITAGSLERHGVGPAVQFARKTNPDHRIIIVGCSLGGAAALMASPQPIDAMVLESVYPTIEEAVDDRVRMRLGRLTPIASPLLRASLSLRLGILPSELRPIDHVDSVGCPLLIMAGDADQHTTLAETERMYQAAKNPKELAVFEGAVHEDLLSFDPERYCQTVLGFLRRHVDERSRR